MSDAAGIAELLRLLEACLAEPAASPARWESFVARIHGLIAGTVVRTLRQSMASAAPELVDDLVQDTYVKLCAHNLAALRRFRGGRPEALVAYLRIVACSVTRDHLRAAIAEKRGSGRVDALDESLAAHVADRRPDPASPDRRILFNQIDRWLASDARTGANRRDRWIFWLYYRYGLTARAIAEIPAVGLSAKGVESTIFRLTRAVREMFGQPFVGAGEGNDAETASR